MIFYKHAGIKTQSYHFAIHHGLGQIFPKLVGTLTQTIEGLLESKNLPFLPKAKKYLSKTPSGPVTNQHERKLLSHHLALTSNLLEYPRLASF